MIVKEIISERVLTLAEAKEILKAQRKSGQEEEKKDKEGMEEEEIRYERRKAAEHTTKFAKLGAKESRALINELLELGKMKEEIAVRIADLMPKSKNEVRAIYAKERFTLTEANIEKILDCVAKYESE
ncbi:MAG: RNA polymerase Rpb4 family protein [Methanophagales archaeon]|nr:RNA polymerase Rpb4 family protein [Methanophagales archaeon]